MAEHDPKCLAYGFGPGQRMDICICTSIRIGRADERERLRAQVEALESPLHWNDGEDALIYRSQVLALLGGESDD